jgi:hypothetical protein
MTRWLVCALVLTSSLAKAQTTEPYWYFRIGPSFGQPVIGSEDTRRGTVYAVGYSKSEPRFSYRGLQGDLMLEAYYLFTKGGGFEDIPVNNMNSFGAMMTARYHTHWLRGADAHFDLGFGLVYNSFTTRDLDTQLNTTPNVGVGASWGRYDFTIRWYHASNGGTSGNNQGTNQIQYLLSYRF